MTRQAIENDLTADGMWLSAGILLSEVPELEPADIIRDAARRLLQDGVKIMVSWDSPEGAILIAEAVNWAAKTICPSYYDLKPRVWAAATMVPGVASGNADDGTVALYHPLVGVAHAHMVDSVDGYWPHPWSGVRRQSWAFRMLRSEKARKLMAWLTEPTATRRQWVAEMQERRAARWSSKMAIAA